MQPAYDVLSYGTIGLDNIIRVPHLPRPDISTHALDVSQHLGGKATNTAVYLSTWGLKVALSGTVLGDDATGDRVLEMLARYPGISTRYLSRQPGLQSMYCDILLTPDGERAIIGIHTEGKPQTPPTREMILDARLLTLDLYGGEERVEAARLAREAGRPVVVGDLRRPDHPVLPCADVVIASAAEVRSYGSGLSLEEFAREAQAHGARGVIITGGAGDVLVFEPERPLIAITPPSVQVVDTTGAGDAFRAGVAYGALQGWGLVECAAMGAAAGSLKVSRTGATSDPPTLEEVLRLARRLPRRRPESGSDLR